jgi:hypothetical protein
MCSKPACSAAHDPVLTAVNGRFRRFQWDSLIKSMLLTKSQRPGNVEWMVDQPFHASHKQQGISQFGVTVKGGFIDPA